jgi:hypothetical protein
MTIKHFLKPSVLIFAFVFGVAARCGGGGETDNQQNQGSSDMDGTDGSGTDTPQGTGSDSGTDNTDTGNMGGTTGSGTDTGGSD